MPGGFLHFVSWLSVSRLCNNFNVNPYILFWPPWRAIELSTPPSPSGLTG
ncbi:hypothetical protein DEFR109230_10440 [Deinococcus frigens]